MTIPTVNNNKWNDPIQVNRLKDSLRDAGHTQRLSNLYKIVLYMRDNNDMQIPTRLVKKVNQTATSTPSEISLQARVNSARTEISLCQ